MLVATLLVASSCTGGLSDNGATTTNQTALPPGGGAGVLAVDDVPERGEPVLEPLEVGANTLVWVHDQEPITMHLDDPAAQLTVTSWLGQGLLEGLHGVSAGGDFFPELLADEGEAVENADGSVIISLALRPDLRWSNGDRLTAAHVAYTWDIWREGCEVDDAGLLLIEGAGCTYLASDRSGLHLISDLVVESDTEFSVEFVRFHAGWRNLFGVVFHPSFGANAHEVNEALSTWRTADGEPLVASGPMVFDQWERGRWLSLATNERYHGSVSPDADNRGRAEIDGVVVRFVRDVETMVRAIESSEGHVMISDPQPGFAERLTEHPDVAVASGAAVDFELVGLNLLNPHLADPLVREALALAVDKDEIVGAVHRPLFGAALPDAVVGNVFFVPGQLHYEDHQVPFSGAQAGVAAEKLAEAGYVDVDGQLEHPERGPLAVRLGTVGSTGLSESVQEVLAGQLRDAGFQIEIDNVDGDRYLTARPYAPDALLASITAGADGDPAIWDVAQFPATTGPWPGARSADFQSSEATNPYGFANDDFDLMATECEATVDDVERAACYNALDLFVTTLEAGDDGLVVIPIARTPAYYVYRSDVLSAVGVASAATGSGPLANVVDFVFR